MYSDLGLFFDVDGEYKNLINNLNTTLYHFIDDLNKYNIKKPPMNCNISFNTINFKNKFFQTTTNKSPFNNIGTNISLFNNIGTNISLFKNIGTNIWNDIIYVFYVFYQ